MRLAVITEETLTVYEGRTVVAEFVIGSELDKETVEQARTAEYKELA